MPIQVLLFDLGSTLIYAKEPWPPIFLHADEELVRVLHRAGIPIDGQTFYDDFGTFIDAYYAQRSEDHVERTSFAALRELLTGQGYANVPDAVLRAALDAMYTVTRGNWCIEEDAIPTLATLKAQGYWLGMISNASDDANVQYQIDQWGLRPYFDFIITSAACGIRKPHPAIFQIALDHFKIQPEQAAMIGDTLSADIVGANNLGMYSIWITRRAAAGSDPIMTALRQTQGVGSGTGPDIQPKAAIQTLSELPPLLENLRSASP